MAFTYDLATKIGQVRLIISDKTESDYHFEDAEITYYLTAEGSVNLAAAGCLESWAAAYALNADNEHIGDYSYAQSVTKKMLDLAKKLRDDEASRPVMTWAEPDLLGTGSTEMAE